MIRLTELDPRSKIVLVLCISSLAVFVENIFLLLAVFVVSFILVQIFDGQPAAVLMKLKRLLVIFCMMAVIQSIFTAEGQAILQIRNFILITDLGLSRGISILLRILIIIISASIMTTSSSREIIQGLAQWKIPYELTFMMAVGIRFLPLLRNEAQDVYTALQLRGINLEKISWSKKIKIYFRLFTPLVASVIHKSRQLSLAVEMRGFRAYKDRTSLKVMNLTRIDYLVISLSLMITAAVFLAYITHFR